jgi:hypothetical protein
MEFGPELKPFCSFAPRCGVPTTHQKARRARICHNRGGLRTPTVPTTDWV